MLDESIEQYKRVFLLARGQFEMIVNVRAERFHVALELTRLQSVRRYVSGNGLPAGNDGSDSDSDHPPPGPARGRRGARARGSRGRGSGGARGGRRQAPAPANDSDTGGPLGIFCLLMNPDVE